MDKEDTKQTIWDDYKMAKMFQIVFRMSCPTKEQKIKIWDEFCSNVNRPDWEYTEK